MQLETLAMRHFPHINPNDYTAETLGATLWLENRYWKQMEIAVANGISLAFGGDE